MRVSVLVDDREPAALVRRLRDHSDVEAVERRRLAAGDVVIGDVGFERKTLRDYINSTMGRRGSDLRDQVARMRASYDHTYVLLEGELRDIDGARTGVSPESLHGSMASVMARHGTPVIPCSDGSRLVDLAVRIGRKHVEDPSTRPLSPGAVATRSEPTAKRIYGCIDGIGTETATALYETYPSVESLVNASLDDLQRVDGVGETRARAIHESLRGGE